MKRSFTLALALAFAPYLFAAPSITSNGVVNASGYQNKLAPDTVLTVFGSGMGPAALVAGSAPDYPLDLAGTSITFTPVSGGTAVTARIVYTIAGQVAGLLPSSIAPGDYQVHVTYNGETSAPENVTVVARSFGIATANNGGTETAQATIGNVNGGISLVRLTSGQVSFSGYNWVLGPSHPGDTLVLWGTGGGADPANDTGGTSGDQTAAGNFVVIVNGHAITPIYAGASQNYPGLWQINFTLPPDMQPDCFATVQVSANGELGNLATIPIAAAGETACSAPGIATQALAKLDANGEFTVGSFAIARLVNPDTNTTVESAAGWVGRTTATKFLLPVSGPEFGYCRIYDRTFPINGFDPNSPNAFLDAGNALLLSGPSVPAGANLASTADPMGPFYSYVVANPFDAGSYTLTGNGGSQVGAFSVSTNFPDQFTVTDWDSLSAINRTAPATVHWTGSGFDRVTMFISENMVSGSTERIININCENMPAGLGSYTVPPEALSYLLPGTTYIAIEAVNQGNFTAPLVGGGQTDIGMFNADLGFFKTVPVQ